MHRLSEAQAAALDESSEAERDAALAEFAEAHRPELEALTAARDAFLAAPQDAGNAAPPLPESASMREQFAEVRRAVIEDGASLEQAESAFGGTAPDP